ncbi:MAG: adenosylmethionine decarboxylase [Proteobacteria bacterium]|nr:adenosylmethionine decarboxylase [Pseudomonadota bacterium]
MKNVTSKFEGPEKKLEIILFEPQSDLRSDADRRWSRVVRASQAEIISRKSNEFMDAYLLSESSLFVWEDRILIITCGQTTLTKAVPAILDYVDRRNVALVFYERKNLMFPQKQPADFEEDVSCIEKYFPGKSYRLGPANHDHIHVFYSSHASIAVEKDATLQILMHDLHPSATRIFLATGSLSKDQIFQILGFNRIFPQMDTDSYLFTPYGYSINGIDQHKYFTVHVTPQPEGSYASFETNVIRNDYSDVIADVVSIFKPEKFSLLLTTSMDQDCLKLHPTVADAVPSYDTVEKSLYEFDCGYAVTFLNYMIKIDDG